MEQCQDGERCSIKEERESFFFTKWATRMITDTNFVEIKWHFFAKQTLSLGNDKMMPNK